MIEQSRHKHWFGSFWEGGAARASQTEPFNATYDNLIIWVTS